MALNFLPQECKCGQSLFKSFHMPQQSPVFCLGTFGFLAPNQFLIPSFSVRMITILLCITSFIVFAWGQEIDLIGFWRNFLAWWNCSRSCEWLSHGYIQWWNSSNPLLMKHFMSIRSQILKAIGGIKLKSTNVDSTFEEVSFWWEQISSN